MNYWFITNKPLSFQSSTVIETGLSDHHKLIAIFVKSHFTRLNPKAVCYRNFKKLDKKSFLNDLKENFVLPADDLNENVRFITDTFINIVERHVALKKRFFRGNQAPFMNKELRKAIYTRSRLRNIFLKAPRKKIKRSTKYKGINVSLKK